jgi:hypothetical protein
VRRIDLSGRQWAILCAATALAVLVAISSWRAHRAPPTSPDGMAWIAELRLIPQVPDRVKRKDYERTMFGTAWTDEVDAAGGRNGCDTRNDILDRDLTDKTYVAVRTCPRAVATGDLRSPYTGDFVSFRRGAQTGAQVQIDHIVPLAYAWDMGAALWDRVERERFANDPANLLAVDGDSNQDKGDQEPGRWMPPRRGVACQYAVQFVVVVKTYGLYLDRPSVAVLDSALRRC